MLIFKESLVNENRKVVVDGELSVRLTANDTVFTNTHNMCKQHKKEEMLDAFSRIRSTYFVDYCPEQTISLLNYKEQIIVNDNSFVPESKKKNKQSFEISDEDMHSMQYDLDSAKHFKANKTNKNKNKTILSESNSSVRVNSECKNKNKNKNKNDEFESIVSTVKRVGPQNSDILLREKGDYKPWWRDNDEELFPIESYKHTCLPKWMYKLKYSQIPSIVGSLKNRKEVKFSNPVEAENYRNLIRECNEIRRDVLSLHSVNGEIREKVRSFIRKLYDNDSSTIKEVAIEKEVPSHYKYVDDVYIYHNDFKQEYFEQRTNRKGDVNEPQFVVGSEKNFIYDLIEKLDKNKYMLTPKRIKSIIKTLQANKVPSESVLELFRRKCRLIKSLQTLTTEHSWFVPYIKQNVLYIQTENKTLLRDLFFESVKQIRTRLLKYVEDILNRENMKNHEKNDIRKARIELFKDYMRRPNIQRMFVEGYTRKEVEDYVYKHHYLDINKQALNGEGFILKRENIKTNKSLTRQKERDLKQIANSCYDFQPESLTITLDERYIVYALSICVGSLAFAALKPYLDDTINFVSKKYDKCNRVLKSLGNIIEKFDEDPSGPLLNNMITNVTKSAQTISNIASSDSVKDFVDASSIYEHFKKALITDSNTYLDPKYKVTFIEIKTMFHGLYKAYNKDYEGASEWFSNFIFTRPETLKNIGKKFYNNFRETHVVYEYQGAIMKIPINNVPQFVNMLSNVNQLNVDNVMDASTSCAFQPETWSETPSQFFEYMSQCINHVTGLGLEMPTPKDIAIANAYFSFINNSKKTINDAIPFAQNMSSYFCRLFFTWDPFDNGFNQHVGEMREIHKEMRTLLTKEIGLAGDSELILKCLACYELANSLIEKPQMLLVPNFVQKVFMETFRQFEKMYRNAEAIYKGVKSRVEPVSILLCGPPSVGKSSMISFFQQIISYCEYGKQCEPTQTYTFDPTSDYWEGYAYQDYVVMDDLFQSNLVDRNSHESLTLIKAVNTASFNLNMAFGNKGNVYFNSKYIFSTTNVCNNGFDNASFSDVGVRDADALRRRFGLVLYSNTEFLPPYNVSAKVWRIDQCVMFPKLKGRTMTTLAICKLIIEIRKKLVAMQGDLVMTVDELEKLKNEMSEMTMELESSSGHSVIVSDVESDEEFEFQREERKDNDYNSTSVTEKVLYWATYEDQRLKREQKEIDAMIKSAPPYDHSKDVFVVPRPTKGESMSEYSKRIYDNTCTQVSRYVQEYKDAMAARALESTAQDNYSYWSKPTTIGLTVLSSVLILGAGVALWQMYKPKQNKPCIDEEEFFSEEPMSPDSYKKRYKRNAERRMIREDAKKGVVNVSYGHNTVQVESLDNSYITCIRNKISKGILYIEGVGILSNDDRAIESTIGFHLKDKFVCVPAHFWSAFNKCTSTTLYLSYMDKKYSMPKPEIEFARVHDTDMIVFKLLKHMDTPPNLIEYMADEANVPVLNAGTSVNMLGATVTGGVDIRHSNILNIQGSVKYDWRGERYVIHTPYYYTRCTDRGDSGALISVSDINGKVVLVGMHLGSMTSQGLSVAMPITQNMMNHIIDTIKSSGEFRTESRELQFPKIIKYVVDACDANRVPSKSKIKRSDLYGWNGEPKCVPVKMSDFHDSQGNVVSPLYNGIAKMSQDEIEETDIPDGVMNWLFHLYPSSGDSRLLTWNEVLNGSTEYGYNSICYSTSSGYPWSKTATKGKNPHIIKTIDDRMDYSPEFFNYVEECENKLLRGEQIDVLWADTLKDETRPKAKVLLGKTRVFSTCPLHYLILVRKYFLHFVTQVQKQCVMKPVSVGINAHSVEWTMLRSRFTNWKSLVAGDFENWDGHVSKQAGQIFCKFVNEWYDDGPINSRVRWLLLEHIWHANHICEQYVFETSRGNPSGNPITSIYNSFAQIIMMYTVLTRDMNLREDQFDIAVYGDDNLIGLDVDGVHYSELADHLWRRFKIKYTHWSKDCNEANDTIETIRYLGRSFVLDGALCRAPLDDDVIDEILYWSKRGDVNRERLKDTASSFFLELSHKGSKEFHRRINQVYRWCEANDKLDAKSIMQSVQKSYNYYYDGMYTEGKRIDFSYGW